MARDRKIAVIGLGYVGLPAAIAFSKHQKIIGFDESSRRISELKKNYDHNNDLSSDELKKTNIFYTSDPQKLKAADFYIIAVPTPLNPNKDPDFSMLINASETVAKNLKKGDIVVYESTVYPGATEEICLPILEKISGLKCGKNFGVGYAPERINPGDKSHAFSNTIKIVAGINEKTLQIMTEVYSEVITAGLFPVSSIKVAEAAKVIENTQRDLNISLINEIAIILHKLNIDTQEVLTAASTKWNFINFKPGLVGGHCIGVDPYYLIHKAQEVGYYPDVILAGRRINDFMGKFVAEQTIKKLIQLGIQIKGARVLVMGITFKENSADTRNSRVLDLIDELKSYGVSVLVNDPCANPRLVKEEYGIELKELDKIADVNAIIIAVAHQEYIEMDQKILQKKLYKPGLVMDIKSILNPKEFKNTKIKLWRL